DEIDLLAVHSLVDHVGQLADGQDVVGLVQKNAVFKRQPFSAHHLVRDLGHPSVLRCDGGEHAPVSSFADRDYKSIIRLAFPSRQHQKIGPCFGINLYYKKNMDKIIIKKGEGASV